MAKKNLRADGRTRTDGRMDEGGNLTTYDGHGVLDWIPVWLHFLISHSQRELSQHGMQSHEMSRETDRKRARRALSPGRLHRRPLPCAHSAIAIRQKRHIQSTPLLRPRLTTADGRTPCGQPVSTTTTTQLSRASSQKLPLRPLALSLPCSYAGISCETQRGFMKWSRTSYDSKKEHSRTRENEKRDTKSPSIITAKKHLQAVVSSGRGSRNALKNY